MGTSTPLRQEKEVANIYVTKQEQKNRQRALLLLKEIARERVLDLVVHSLN